MTRQQANRKIISMLAAAVERLPDQRFEQLLCNYGIGNFGRYDVESSETRRLMISSSIEEALNEDRDDS